MAPSFEAEHVLPVDFRPKLEKVIHLEETPVIDFSVIHSPECGNLESFLSQVRKAWKEWDFFVIVNHGLPPELYENLKKVMTKFSALPYEEKKKTARDVDNPLGYHDKDHTKKTRDWVEVFDYVVKEGIDIPANLEPDCKETVALKNLWPQNPEEFQKACQAYGRETTKLAFKVLETIALALGMPAARFDPYFEETTTIVRLNHYPPCPSPELALGKGPHVDTSAFTLLSTDEVSGLEVRRKSDGEWFGSAPHQLLHLCARRRLPGIMKNPKFLFPSFFFFFFLVWTNDQYNGLLHRVVVNSQQERFSFITLFTPSYHAIVEPLEGLVHEEDPPKYRPFKWGEYLITRSLNNYMKLDKPVLQISDYKIRD
ncbi:hypothetical protein AMTRI_Chr13g91420 [Amborella trichopoda]